MMDLRNNAWLRRAIFVGANLAAAAVIAWGLAMPIHGFFTERDTQIAEQRALLTRLNAIAALEPAIAAAARQVAEESNRGEVVRGANEGVINADLQTALKLKAEQSGARVRTSQVLSPRAIDGTTYVGTRLDITGALGAIQRTIYAIESARPYHFITDALIKPSAPNVVPGLSAEPVIEARLDIFVPFEITGTSP